MAREKELPPPLEMACLNALWQLGEGNVEDVRGLVSTEKPLAYTTVLTLLERLSKRGAVSRRKEGRGFRYRAVADRDKLRRIALHQLVESHFENDPESLRNFLNTPSSPAQENTPPHPQESQEPEAAVAQP
jgi:predicted transcriptional regulator